MARKKKTSDPLHTDEALRRTDQICPLVAKDTWLALRARVAFETANEWVLRADFSRESKFGDIYHVIHNALLIMMALAIARVFDLSDNCSNEHQDKASVPVLAHL